MSCLRFAFTMLIVVLLTALCVACSAENAAVGNGASPARAVPPPEEPKWLSAVPALVESMLADKSQDGALSATAAILFEEKPDKMLELLELYRRGYERAGKPGIRVVGYQASRMELPKSLVQAASSDIRTVHQVFCAEAGEGEPKPQDVMIVWVIRGESSRILAIGPLYIGR